jgi:tetratricopeptide (TPR) repeat protein
MAESDEAGAEAEAPLRTGGRRDSQQLAAFRATPRTVTQAEAPRLAARPYAWTPEADAAARDASEIVEKAPIAGAKKAPPAMRWPWIGAGLAALVAVAFAVAGPSHSSHNTARRGSGQAYRRAVNLIEAGQYDDAIKRLQGVIQSKNFEPEALLTLGVLEIEAKQFNSGRTHLQAYLAMPDARHADRAKKLYDFVFAAGPGGTATNTAPGATPTGG